MQLDSLATRPNEPTYRLEDLNYTGNIDLNARKVLDAGNGVYKTEESITVGFDNKQVIIPTVIDGKKVTDDEAVNYYKKTGQHLGMYDTVEQADAQAQKIHLRQQDYYKPTMGVFKAGFIEGEMSKGSLGFFQRIKPMAKNNAALKAPDYKENQKYYEAWANAGHYFGMDYQQDITNFKYEQALKDGIYKLDAQGNVVHGDNYFIGSDFFYDMDTMKGFLLAKKNNLDFHKEYQDIVYKNRQEIERAYKGENDTVVNKLLGLVGGASSYVTDPEFIPELTTSPGHIVGSTVLKGAGIAFGAEFGAAGIGEMMRHNDRVDHDNIMGEQRSTTDYLKESMLNMAIAGGARSVGSAGVDIWAQRSITKQLDGGISSDIAHAIYYDTKHIRLTDTEKAHYASMYKAQEDLENGRPVQVEPAMTQDINEKTDPSIEEVNLYEETQKIPEVQQDNLDMQNLSEATAKEYDMADPAAQDTQTLLTQDEWNLIRETSNSALWDDPEAQALMQEFENARLEHEAIVSGKAAKQKGFQAQTMTINGEQVTKTDFDLIQAYQKTREWNLKNPSQKREISERQQSAVNRYDATTVDSIKDMDFKREIDAQSVFDQEAYDGMTQAMDEEYKIVDGDLLDLNGNPIFAKFGDHLAAGTIAGVEVDENGNVTFDPEKFIAGMVGYGLSKRAAIKLAPKVGQLYKQGYEEMIKSAGGGTPPKMGILERKAASGVPSGRKLYHPERDKNYIYDEATDTVYFEARGTWREMPNEEIRNDIKFINEKGINAFREKIQKRDAAIEEARKIELQQYEEAKKAKESPDYYKDAHTAPTRDQDNTTSIDDLTKIYPEDVYSKDGARYYGHGEKAKDDMAMYIFRKIKGNPKAKVKIYRSVPKHLDVDINPGDWVTITKQYAKEHGENRFDGNYKIIEKEVKAEDIITDGNSIHEQGYDPKVNNIPYETNLPEVGYHNTDAVFDIKDARVDSGSDFGTGFYLHLDKKINDANLKEGQHTMVVPIKDIRVKEYNGKRGMNTYRKEAFEKFPKASQAEAFRLYNEYLVDIGYDAIRGSSPGHGDMLNIINKNYLEKIGNK